jgi:hypothetical protein
VIVCDMKISSFMTINSSSKTKYLICPQVQHCKHNSGSLGRFLSFHNVYASLISDSHTMRSKFHFKHKNNLLQS